MSKMIHVSPMPGKRVINPFNGYTELPRAGIMTPDDAFWRKRQAEGGVAILEQHAGAPAPQPDAAPATPKRTKS